MSGSFPRLNQYYVMRLEVSQGYNSKDKTAHQRWHLNLRPLGHESGTLPSELPESAIVLLSASMVNNLYQVLSVTTICSLFCY